MKTKRPATLPADNTVNAVLWKFSIFLNDEGGVRLRLEVTAPVAEDIIVFGQAPCSAGRRKRRNVSYLGLLPAAQDGLSEITALYVAR